MLKRQQFKDSKSNIIKSSVSKLSPVDEHDNEERQSLDKYQSKNNIYFPCLLFSQKELNRPTDQNKKRKGLKPPYIYIKITLSDDY